VREVVREDIQQLKQQPGGDMVGGGANLAATFTRLGLIDEYWIYLQPVVLGAGPLIVPDFASTAQRRIEWFEVA
jgi:riboflavin biosynthesis pyrimidine reductase